MRKTGSWASSAAQKSGRRRPVNVPENQPLRNGLTGLAGRDLAAVFLCFSERQEEIETEP
jgi:hypothetical protein